MTSNKGTFIVQVLNTQNSTWQGTITWSDQNRTEAFRSALELIRLIDSALSSQGDTWPTAAEDAQVAI